MAIYTLRLSQLPDIQRLMLFSWVAHKLSDFHFKARCQPNQGEKTRRTGLASLECAEIRPSQGRSMRKLLLADPEARSKEPQAASKSLGELRCSWIRPQKSHRFGYGHCLV